MRLLIQIMSVHEWVVSAGLTTSLYWYWWLSIFLLLRLLLISPTLIVLLISLSITLEVPGIIHHQCKIVIIVNADRDICVVLQEFFKCNSRVSLLLMFHIVMHFKCLEEFHQNLSFSLFTLNNIGMFGSIVNVLDVININETTAISVNLSESLLY